MIDTNLFIFLINFADRTRDPNNQIYIGLTVAIPVFAVILVIVMITVAIIYCFKKKTPSNTYS